MLHSTNTQPAQQLKPKTTTFSSTPIFMNWKKTLLICLLILLVAGGVTTLIFMTEPTASKGGATKKTAMLVDVIPVERSTYQPNIIATGTVQAAQDITLSPRVSGQILSITPSFVPGGFVRKGQTLLQIDPADYENTLALRQSDLSQAMADLNIEKGRQEIARRDYQLVGDTLSQENKDLVLRQPQLEAVQARIEAAKASIKQAELALERTTVKAPFDAHILTRTANVGSQVAPGNALGRLVGINEYWVETTVPLAQLSRLSMPSARTKGSAVKIRNRNAWPDGTYRTGYVKQLIGTLDDQTRLARVLVSVPDPMAYRQKNTPRLIIGSFVETSIEGKPINDVIRLNRDYVREDNTVWIMEEDKLRIKDISIVFQDATYAYISDGLSEGDRVVTTNLATVVEGTDLRLEQSQTDTTSTSISLSE